MCHKEFMHLGSHIWHKHHLRARDYKEKYGLPYAMSLISEEVRIKKQLAFEEHREKYIKNLFVAGEKYRFQKGQSGHRRISEHERKTILSRINEVNKNRKDKPCPVCKMVFHNVASHLYNAHDLLFIK